MTDRKVQGMYRWIEHISKQLKQQNTSNARITIFLIHIIDNIFTCIYITENTLRLINHTNIIVGLNTRLLSLHFPLIYRSFTPNRTFPLDDKVHSLCYSK